MGYFSSFKNAWGDLTSGDFGKLKNDVFDKFSPLYQIYHQRPADLQRAAYQNAADALDKLGREQRDWYLAQGDKALSYYGKGNEVAQPMQPQPDYYAAMPPPPPPAAPPRPSAPRKPGAK